MFRKTMALLAILLLASVATWAANDKTRANSYDDAWETNWVTHCRTIYTTSGKFTGFVLQIGDSITHSNGYSQWPRYGAGKTSEDTTICTWILSTTWGSGNSDTACKNGWYLAAADTSGRRGMTASSGIDTSEMISGAGNVGTTMPNTAIGATARGYVADGIAYSGNLQINTICAAFGDAQFAVLMLGTNDASGSVAVDTFTTNLTTIIDALEARNVVVILSTIPPHIEQTTLVHDTYNPAIRTLAQTKQIPLIDFEAEVLARHPADWNGTLLGLDDVHPSASWGAYDSSSNPYVTTGGGNTATHTTGESANNVGELLRSWLAVQKMKEVKYFVVDGNNPTPTLAITTASPLTGATEGSAYSVTLQAANITGSATWTVTAGTLPSGLTLSTAGVLSGTPAAGSAGPYNFTIQVADTAPDTDSKVFALTVQPASLYTVSGAITGLLFPADDITINYVGDKSGSVITTNTGTYSITSLDDLDSITITPDPAGYTFTPTNSVRAIAGANITGVNFAAVDANTDGDGLPDAWEIHYWLNTISQNGGGDADSDGSTNLEEYTAGTNPKDNDTDNDGMPDGWEMVNGTDPVVDDANADPDDDGFTNLEEYKNGTDPRKKPDAFWGGGCAPANIPDAHNRGLALFGLGLLMLCAVFGRRKWLA